jgi:hypothetical protein
MLATTLIGMLFIISILVTNQAMRGLKPVQIKADKRENYYVPIRHDRRH